MFAWRVRRPLSGWAEAAIWIAFVAATAAVAFVAALVYDAEAVLGLSALVSVLGSVIGTTVATIALFDGVSRWVSACALAVCGSVLAFWVLVLWWLSGIA